MSGYLYTPDSGKPIQADNPFPTQLMGSKVTEGIADFRLNTQGTLLASAARVASVQSPDQTNYNARGVQLLLNVSTAGATGGLIVKIYGKSAAGTVYQLNSDPVAVTATGRYVYEIYPGSTGTGVGVAQRVSGAIPRTWTVVVSAVDGASYSYSLEYSLIL